MECTEARDHLIDLVRGHLEAETAAAVRAHVARCPECAAALQTQTEVRSLIRAHLPRYAAPAALHARIRASADRPPSPGWRAWWSGLRRHPWTSGLVGAAAVVILVWGGLLWVQPDPTARLLQRAVAEHAEYTQETMHLPASDPQMVLGQLRAQAPFSLPGVFRGDSQVQLVAAHMDELSGTPVATVIYRDTAGHYTTLFLMPDQGKLIPEADRLSNQAFRPYHRVLSGRQVLLWKQPNLACIIVSDLDETGAAQRFLKIRTAA